MEFLGRLVLDSPAALLSWLGRQGPRAVAALIVIGIAFRSKSRMALGAWAAAPSHRWPCLRCPLTARWGSNGDKEHAE
jgi:hypothetical protein